MLGTTVIYTYCQYYRRYSTTKGLVRVVTIYLVHPSSSNERTGITFRKRIVRADSARKSKELKREQDPQKELITHVFSLLESAIGLGLTWQLHESKLLTCGDQEHA